MESLTTPPGATTSHLPPITAHSRRDRGNLTRHGVRWRPLFPHSRVCVAVYSSLVFDTVATPFHPLDSDSMSTRPKAQPI